MSVKKSNERRGGERRKEKQYRVVANDVSICPSQENFAKITEIRPDLTLLRS
jgi:hypothetical protein